MAVALPPDNSTTSPLSREESTALMVLAYFLVQTGKPESAERALKALLSLEPDNRWAQHFLVICTDACGKYAQVLQLTEDLATKKAELTDAQFKALTLARARALQKSGRSAEAQELCATLLTPTKAPNTPPVVKGRR